MKKYSDNMKCAFATALCCMVWMAAASRLGLPGWAGFTGCTAYFAAPAKGAKSLPVTLASVISGILYALVSIYAGGRFPGETVGLILTFVTTFLMCAGGSTRFLAFVPGAFMGSFSTFAAGGSIKAVIAIIIGVFLGYVCDGLGKLMTGGTAGGRK